MDSASNEVTSVHDATVEVGEGGAFLPNAKFILRDAAHASRRLLQRPWTADPVLEKLIGMSCQWKGSLGQMVHHSEALRAIYHSCSKAAVSEAPVSTAFGNLRCAQHRFETHVTPLSRIVLGLTAFFTFAVTLVESRKNEQGKTAEAWLDMITPGMLIILAMLADAGIESLGLIRTFDRESMETADMCMHISDFLDRITWLFHESGVEVVSGHTKEVLRWLSQPHFFMYNGKVKVIGKLGSLDDWQIDLRVAYGHLRSWTVLAKDVLQAEFPCFALVSAFAVFSLRNKNYNKPIGMDTEDKIRRMETTWQLDHLEDQYREFHPIASRIFALGETETYLEAWSIAMKRCERNKRQPKDLVFALQRFAAFSSSTSGIEQSFSKIQKLLPASRLVADVDKDSESRLISLLVDQSVGDPVEETKVCQILSSCTAVCWF